MSSTEGKRFTLDDIIAEQVKKQVANLATGSSGGGGVENFGIKDISDITKLLSELNKLGSLRATQGVGVQKGVPDGESKVINAEVVYPEPQRLPPPPPQKIRFDIPKLVDNVITYMPLIIMKYGDLKLSEVKEILIKDKADIVKVIEGFVESAQT